MEANQKATVWGLRLLFLVCILSGWQFASGRVIPDFFMSKPTEIFPTFWGWTRSGELLYHASYTILEALAGFLLGSMVGMVVGIWLGRSEMTAMVLDPFVTMFYSLP